MRDNASQDFLNSLKPDDLVAATVLSSSKLHIIRIVRRVTREMLRGDPGEQEMMRMVDGRVLCAARPRYFWRPVEDIARWAKEDRCWHCFNAWRHLGRPELKGWKHSEATVVSRLKLPFGWEEVTPQGHPYDLPEDAPEPAEGEEKIGERRREVRRWIRGIRYVRITQSFVDKRFTSRYGAEGDKPDAEGSWITGGWDVVLPSAVTLMALGGERSRTTGYDKLTMKDIKAEAAIDAAGEQQ